jgi:hypothetical protein
MEVHQLRYDGKGLKLRNNWNPPLMLTAIAQDEFNSDALGTLVSHRDAKHGTSGLIVFSGNTLDVVFQKTSRARKRTKAHHLVPAASGLMTSWIKNSWV